MIVVSVTLGIVGVALVILGTYWVLDDDPGPGAVAMVWGAIAITLAVISGVILYDEENQIECSKVYEPDGSYVETCEYPAEDE